MGIYRGEGVGGEDQSKGKKPHPRKGGAMCGRMAGFPTLPLGPSSRIAYVSKTPKNPMGKYGERAHRIRLLMLHELPHQKPQCEKHQENSHKGKRVQSTQHQVEYSIIRIEIHR